MEEKKKCNMTKGSKYVIIKSGEICGNETDASFLQE